MSGNIGNIEELRKKYSFLNKIWDVYDEFDETTKGNEHEKWYIGVCDPIIRTYVKDKEKYKNFCMQLVRNLGCYPGDNKYLKPSSSRCQILYYWIYNSMKKHNIPDDVIKECFKDYIRIMGIIKEKANCNYHSYDELYKEPMSLILLDIFESSIVTIRNVLMSSDESPKIPYQNYVCEFVKTHKDVYKKYCPNSDPNDIKGQTTCSRLSTLKQIYEYYFFNLEGLNTKVPPLDDTDEDYFSKCTSEEKLSAISEVADHKLSELSPSRGYNGEISLNPLPSVDINGENRGNRVSSTVSTTLGTVAGASSILALLYKFTPGRKWLHSGIKGSRGRMSGNLYAEEPNELLYNGHQYGDFNSYNIGYEAI